MFYRRFLGCIIFGAWLWLAPTAAVAAGPADWPLATTGTMRVTARVPLSAEQAAALKIHSSIRVINYLGAVPTVTATVRNYADSPQANHTLAVTVSDRYRRLLWQRQILTDAAGRATLTLEPLSSFGWHGLTITDRTFARVAPLFDGAFFSYPPPARGGTINLKKQTAALFDYEGQNLNLDRTFNPLFGRGRRALAFAR